MSRTLDLVKTLRDILALDYGARIADYATVPGAVTAVIMPVSGNYQQGMCDLSPLDITVDITLLAAQAGPQGAVDLLGHLDTVALLARGAGFTPTDWRTDQVNDLPALTITCTAPATG
jgi:hypothetical protein